MAETTTLVYFDGACPLCVREIGMLRRLDKNQRLSFEDVSPPGAAESCPLPQAVMLARFHVRRSDGVLVDGAEAFLAAYAQLPGLSWLGRAGRSRLVCAVLNRLYGGFLKVRPFIQRLAGKPG